MSGECWVQGGVLGAAFWLLGTVAVPWGKRVLDKLDALGGGLAQAAEREEQRDTRAVEESGQNVAAGGVGAEIVFLFK